MIFDCKLWAVVRVDIANNADGSIVERDTTASIGGLWDTITAANRWTEQQKPVTERPHYYPADEGYATEAYIVIPCLWPQLKYLSDLERIVEAAAKLQVLLGHTPMPAAAEVAINGPDAPVGGGK